MVDAFEMQPEWSWYQQYSVKTQKVMELWGSSNTNWPTGNITGPLAFGDLTDIKTPMTYHVRHSDYDRVFYLMNIALDQSSIGEVYVDAFILTEGLTEEQQLTLSANEFSFEKDDPICCWNFAVNQTFFEHMMTGFARITVHHREKGILSFREGHFKHGK